MRKLLSANFMRLKKDKFFWAAMTFLFAAGVCFPVMRYADMKQTGTINHIDNGFFGCALFIGIVMAVFCSLFICTEYSDGAIRNPIIAGRTRTAIYFSNAITSALVSVVMCAAFFLPYLCVGIPLLGAFTADTHILLLFGLAVFLLAIAFSSIFTWIAMLCPNRTIAAVICILLVFACLLTGTILNAMLDAPKTHTTYTLDENNHPVASETPNPKYLEGTKREIFQTLYDINPGGQSIQCASMSAVHIQRLPIYSLIMVLGSTGVGVLFFRKKDLK